MAMAMAMAIFREQLPDKASSSYHVQSDFYSSCIFLDIPPGIVERIWVIPPVFSRAQLGHMDQDIYRYIYIYIYTYIYIYIRMYKFGCAFSETGLK
jgi:hypothetical protein